MEEPARPPSWGQLAVKPLIQLKDGQLIQSGIKPSLPAIQDKLWKDASNVIFGDQSAEKAKGIQYLGSTVGNITGMAQAFVSGQQRVYLGTATKLYRYANGTTTTLTGTFTGQRWSMLPWGTWLLAVNGVDVPQVCKDTTTAVAWANVPTAALGAKIVRKLAERPLLFYGQEVAWPRATDIEAWATPDPTGRAGNFFIRDLDSVVVAVEPLGDVLVFYTKNKMGFATFLGGQLIYGFKIKLEGFGAFGLNSVIPVGARHFGMGPKGFWVTDGSGWDDIGRPDINRYVTNHVDPARGDDVVGIHVKDRSMVEWFFPGLDNVVHGFGYNYKTGAWQHLHLPITAGLPAEVFDNPLAAAGQVWGLFDSTDNIAGNPLVSSLTSGPFDAGLPNNYKHWDMVQLNIESAGLVEVRFGLHRFETFGNDATDAWTAWTPLTRENWLGTGGLDSVYLTMELRSTAVDTNWRLGGLAVHGEEAGATQ